MKLPRIKLAKKSPNFHQKKSWKCFWKQIGTDTNDCKIRQMQTNNLFVIFEMIILIQVSHLGIRKRRWRKILYLVLNRCNCPSLLWWHHWQLGDYEFSGLQKRKNPNFFTSIQIHTNYDTYQDLFVLRLGWRVHNWWFFRYGTKIHTEVDLGSEKYIWLVYSMYFLKEKNRLHFRWYRRVRWHFPLEYGIHRCPI